VVLHGFQGRGNTTCRVGSDLLTVGCWQLTDDVRSSSTASMVGPLRWDPSPVLQCNLENRQLDVRGKDLSDQQIGGGLATMGTGGRRRAPCSWGQVWIRPRAIDGQKL
jgi:hypothetical protein